jgi:hypothetical protein
VIWYPLIRRKSSVEGCGVIGQPFLVQSAFMNRQRLSSGNAQRGIKAYATAVRLG